jgi:UDP-N-acetylmuramyl pentapeptide phosphotransferase/UDP-N-acetylglucosamine-1-phosphate transferase
VVSVWDSEGEGMNATIIFLGCLGGVITWLVLYPLRAYLERRDFLDVPNERSSHRRPTPRGGGLVVVGVVLAGWVLFGMFTSMVSGAALASYALACAVIAAVSWKDDVSSLSARVRFGVHTLGAVLAMLAFGFWDSLMVPGLGEVPLGWFGLPVTFVWIVGMTNAYNFMDGIDGIAGSQALVAGLGWAVLGWLIGLPTLSVLGLLVAASSLGFLVHNWSPARIFMGDVGSAFLGYTFAVLPLMMKSFSQNKMVSDRAFFIGILMLWPFVADTAFTMVRRLRLGENIFTAHRMHLYQRLISLGFSHRSVTVCYAALALAGVIIAVGWSIDVPVSEACAPVILLFGLALWVFIAIQERRGAITPSSEIGADLRYVHTLPKPTRMENASERPQRRSAA